MAEEIDPEIIALLEDALVIWRTIQTRAKGSVSLNKFAEDIGAGRSLVSMWMLGERPVTLAYRRKIAKPVADLVGPDAYRILDVTPPNPYLQKINQLFGRISPENQRKLAEIAESYESKNNESKVRRASKERKTSPR